MIVRIKNADVAKLGSSKNCTRQMMNRIKETVWFMIVAVPVLVDFRISRKSSEIAVSYTHLTLPTTPYV